MNASESQDYSRKQLIEILNNLMNSRITITNHREIAAWAAAILYITSIIAMFKVISDNSELLIKIGHLPFGIVIIIYLIIVVLFIHSQYGQHVSSRSIHAICLKYIFLLSNHNIDMDGIDWTIESNNALPNFHKEN